MKIYGITNSINFGYNKDLNDQVNKKLEKAKGNKELANTLLEMNKFCNETEDKLRQAEKEHNTFLKDKYFDILLQLKGSVACEMEERFPKLNYRKQEIESYRNEIEKRHIKNEYHWLVQLADDLEVDESLITMAENYNDKVAREEDAKTAKELDTENTADKAPQTEKKKERKKESRFVEKFEPTEYSPKGFKSLGGMSEIKDALTDKILYPLQNPEGAKLDEIEYGKKAPRGELFYGPPGCGKTSVIEALAMESGLPLYKLKIAKAGSIYVNGSAKNVQQGYEYVRDIAKETGKPVILAMDEMEAMTSKRDKSNEEETQKLVGTLLQIIEEARGNNVIIIGATNFYDMLDDAIKSRFDDKIYVGLPDDETRKSVLKIHLNRRTKGQVLASNEEELNKVVKLTKGFSNRDIAILTDKAALIARADKRRNIIADDFIVPVKENQNMKVKEDLYKDKTKRPVVGFNF